MEDTKLEESLDFVDAIDFANGLRNYDEGAKDVIHAIGNGFKKVFGSNAGAAQRNFDDAKQNLQTAQLNQQAAALNAQANQMNAQLNQKANAQANQQTKNQTNALDDITLAKNLNDIVTKALKIAGDGLTNAQNQQMQKNADKGEQEAVKNGATADDKTPANQNGTPVDGANRETSTDVPENGGKQ